MTNERNIQALTEQTVNLSGSVQRMGVEIAEVKALAEKTYEAVGGNNELGHTGLADQVKENRKALKDMASNHNDFLRIYEIDKAKHGKRLGFFTGLGVVLGAGLKWILIKIGLFV